MESTPKSHFKSRSQSQIPQSCAIEGLDNFIKNNDAYVIWWAWARRWGLLRSAVSTNPTTYERVLMFFDQIRKLSVHAGLSPQICINLLSFSMLPFWLASSQRTWTCICWLSGLLDVVARSGQPSDLLEKVPLNAFINLTLETNCRLQICWLEWGGILYKSLLEKMSLQENLRQPLTYREAQRDELEWSVCVCVCVCVCVGIGGTTWWRVLFQRKKHLCKHQRDDKGDTALFLKNKWGLCTYCCFSVINSCPALCNPMNCSTSDFLVFHYLPELAEDHVHWVSDAIQPSHPLLPAFPFASKLSLHQSIF